MLELDGNEIYRTYALVRVAPTADDDKSNSTVSGTAPLYWHPDQEEIKVSNAPIIVNWQVSTSKTFNGTVSSGTVYTSSDIDYTVKVSLAFEFLVE